MIFINPVQTVVQESVKSCQMSSVELLLINFAFWKFVAVSTICMTGFLLRYVRSMVNSLLQMISSWAIVVRMRNGGTEYVEHDSHDADMLSMMFLIFWLTCSGRVRLSRL